MCESIKELVEKAFPLQSSIPKLKIKEQEIDVQAEFQRVYQMYDQLLARIEQLSASKPKVDNTELEREVLLRLLTRLGPGESRLKGYPGI